MQLQIAVEEIVAELQMSKTGEVELELEEFANRSGAFLEHIDDAWLAKASTVFKEHGVSASIGSGKIVFRSN